MSDKKQELEQLIASRVEAEAKEAEAEAARELDRAIAGERAIADAVAKHGPLNRKVAALRTSAGVIVVKKPHHLEVRKLGATANLSEADAIKFVKTCLVHPAAAELELILEEYPLLGGDLMSLVLRLARGRSEEVAGKS